VPDLLSVVEGAEGCFESEAERVRVVERKRVRPRLSEVRVDGLGRASARRGMLIVSELVRFVRSSYAVLGRRWSRWSKGNCESNAEHRPSYSEVRGG